MKSVKGRKKCKSADVRLHFRCSPASLAESAESVLQFFSFMS